MYPFEYRRNLSLFWKVTIGGFAFFKSQSYLKYYKNNVTEAQIFSQWKDFLFLTGYRLFKLWLVHLQTQ